MDNNFHDKDGNPAGGSSTGIGYTIAWQNGPCPNVDDRNGAFLIEVLESCYNRLAHYQDSRFACVENEAALVNLAACIYSLKMRRDRRTREGTLGTHEVDKSEEK